MSLAKGKDARERGSPRCSVVMAGLGGVGKSSLTLRFVYDDFSESYDPTRADSYCRVLPQRGDDPGSSLVVDILDTAGQEEYAAIRDNYYRSGDGFMLVFSVAEESTFRAAVRLRDQICRAVDEAHPPILLVGNKCDITIAERQVSAARAEGLASSWQFSRYMETSAKMNEGVEEAYLALLDLIDYKQAARAAAAAAATKLAASQKQSKRFRCILQ